MSPASRMLREYRHSPVKMVHDWFGISPDPWQIDALNSFADPDPKKFRISLQACAGPGKSAVLAWCGWNFMACYAEPGEHPKAACMSVTKDNLKDNLWAEMAKWQERSEFLKAAFHHTSERIFAKDHPKTWFMSSRSIPKKANAEEIGRVLSGLHSKFVLYLIDESGDIPPQVLKSAEQGLSTGPVFGKIVQAGNPTSSTGCLYTASKDPSWYVIRITGDPDDVRRSSRISADWAREMILKYGRDNPWVMSFILGLFPPTSVNQLLSPDEVRDAMQRTVPASAFQYAQKRLGVDVARFGDDRTILFPRQGLVASKCAEMRNARTNDIAARAMMARMNWTKTGTKDLIYLVDGTGGFGAGVVDGLIQAGESPIEVSFSGKAIDPRYLNKRAEMWFAMADWVRRGGVLPNDPELVRELTSPTYYFQGGKFQLEGKDDIKSRLGFSPDKADALCLTFGLPDMPARDSLPGAVQNRMKSDYDALDDSRR